LIAENENDYIEKAISLTKNKKILDLRKSVYDNALRSPLFDKKRFSKQFFGLIEKIYA
jgi:predicted O-linked N-acetylglucosamine transferase (SPINDLY family)